MNVNFHFTEESSDEQTSSEITNPSGTSAVVSKSLVKLGEKKLTSPPPSDSTSNHDTNEDDDEFNSDDHLSTSSDGQFNIDDPLPTTSDGQTPMVNIHLSGVDIREPSIMNVNVGCTEESSDEETSSEMTSPSGSGSVVSKSVRKLGENKLTSPPPPDSTNTSDTDEDDDHLSSTNDGQTRMVDVHLSGVDTREPTYELNPDLPTTATPEALGKINLDTTAVPDDSETTEYGANYNRVKFG